MCALVCLNSCENYPSRYAAAPSFRAGRIAEVLGRKAVAAATACVAGRRDVVADAAAVAVAVVNPRGATPSREFRTVGWTALWGPWSEIQVVGLVCVVCVCVYLMHFGHDHCWISDHHFYGWAIFSRCNTCLRKKHSSLSHCQSHIRIPTKQTRTCLCRNEIVRESRSQNCRAQSSEHFTAKSEQELI